MQAHKRACRIINIPDIQALLKAPLELVDEDEDDINDMDNDLLPKESVLIGIKFPSNSTEWEQANNYVQTRISIFRVGLSDC